MMAVLNRLRGTIGVWSKVIGLLLALIVEMVYHNHYVAVAVGLGYIIGESFGWGEWVGCLTSNRNNYKDTTDEGKYNGIMWLSQKIVPDWRTNFIDYSRVALTIRGFYWWLPTLAPLYFVGFNPLVLLGCILFLSVGFPISCEIGYRTSKLFSFEKFGLSYVGGWELQEGFYGMLQDLVLVVLVLFWIGV